MRVPPPTHTQTLGIHVRLSAKGFGAHRIWGWRTLMFSHICRLRPFLGVQNLLIFFGIFMRVPPHTHTHTNTGHTCTSKCKRVWCSSHLRMRGSRFSLFFVCLFHRGAHMLRSLTSFFFFSNGKLVRMTCKSLL